MRQTCTLIVLLTAFIILTVHDVDASRREIEMVLDKIKMNQITVRKAAKQMASACSQDINGSAKLSCAHFSHLVIVSFDLPYERVAEALEDRLSLDQGQLNEEDERFPLNILLRKAIGDAMVVSENALSELTRIAPMRCTTESDPCSMISQFEDFWLELYFKYAV